MNNESVAWAIKSDGDWTEIGWDDEVLHEVEEWYTAQGWQYEYVPLYTHPAKTLTKDELKSMWQIAISKAYKEEDGEAYEFFADSILKKASEK
jgi:hypothetical protein